MQDIDWDFAPVLIVGGGPVGMTLAVDLARKGIKSILVERNFATTSHPKMDITNGRSMELFGRAGLVDALRAVAVDERNPFDVSWITSLAGHELHRFRYPSVTESRMQIRATNDGKQPREPGMRVSQVEIEPVLKQAIDRDENVDVRFGVEFLSLKELESEVIATVHDRLSNREYKIRCNFLIGCDGGSSRVRDCIGIALSGEARIMPRFMTHFRSNARELLQRWGVAWHYQSVNGTLIAQNDKDTWTLHSRFPAGQTEDTVNPSALLTRFAGRTFDHEVLVANPWSPHLLVADEYQRKRVLIAGDAAHQYIPTGGYGMNTGIADAFDIGWKLAAVLQGFGGPNLVASYALERRPVGLRNCKASGAHNEIRIKIGALYQNSLDADGEEGRSARQNASETIRRLGNAENESRGVEFGYVYFGSPIVAHESTAEPAGSFVDYEPTTMPGARLPSLFLQNGLAVYDLLGPWFTLLAFDGVDISKVEDAALKFSMPLKVLRIDDEHALSVFDAHLVLVRPDHHVAWRTNSVGDPHTAVELVGKALGW